MRSRLLWGLLLPMLALVALNTASLYRQALRSADTAYDRTLLASAKSLGELLDVERIDGRPRVRSTVQYSALEAFESDNRSSMFYKVTGFDGEAVAGYPDLPPWHGQLPSKGLYAALVDFYDAEYRGEPVRVAVLLQPVAGRDGMGVATIQVAETLELRKTLARQILLDTVWRQAALLGVLVVVVVVVVQRATQPVRDLSRRLRERREGDLTPIDAGGAPKELRPLMEATNDVMARLQHLLDHQKRFVRDASHQLRTPLAVLKVQVQSALRGDVPPRQALEEINSTVERATELANQMLALAKVEQLRQQGRPAAQDWAAIVRAVALDVAPLAADSGLDLSLETQPASVEAHPWALRELTRNLLHNAVKHGPPGSALQVRLTAAGGQAVLTVCDEGPGISAALRQRLFQPFSAGEPGSGSGLGLAICREIAESIGGSIVLDNRPAAGAGGEVAGLDVVVRLPLADNTGRP
ncbi:sensor histidine kinase [Aquincola sp. MAHUQ-54]|uniref:histidine kinase n=1 Tax=Aquincola agrisoli TaxID=3119538 RepID=A0AAW9QF83_9BURK